MTLRFLVDECLPPVLATRAQGVGYEAIAVAHHGMAGKPDHQVMEFAENGSHCVVTNNRDDFLALLKVRELHPGLIVLKGSTSLNGREQQFEVALKEVEGWADAINKVVEVGVDLEVTVYDLPTLM